MSNIGRYLDWDLQTIKDYFSLRPSQDVGCFWRGEPFAPYGLGTRSPSQLHETQRHKGCYVQLDGLGCPKQKAFVDAWIDGIPWSVMNSAVRCVKECKPEHWATFEALSKKHRIQTLEVIARRYCIDVSTVKRRRNTVLEAIDDFLESMYKMTVNDAS